MPTFNDPVLYYTMDTADISGTTITDHGSGRRNGTLTGSPTTGVTGQVGQAISFSAASSQYIAVASPSLIGNGTAFTITAWVNAASPPSIGCIYGEGNTTSGKNQSIRIAMLSSGVFRAYIRDDVGGSLTNFSASGAYNDGLWHQVALIQTAKNSRRIFVDGNGSATNTTTLGTLTLDNAKVGAINTASSLVQFFNGSLDEVRTYNRALSTGAGSDLEALIAYTGATSSRRRRLLCGS